MTKQPKSNKTDDVKAGERLRQFLKFKFSSLTDAARVWKKSTSQIDSYVNRGVQPSAQIMHDLVMMGLNINWLLTGDGEMLNAPEHGTRSQEESEAQAFHERIANTQKNYAGALKAEAGSLPGPAVKAPPDEVVTVRDIEIIDRFSVAVITKNKRKILYVKTNE